jgi:hypothetical protein
MRINDVVSDLELALSRPEVVDVLDDGLLLRCCLCDVRLLD